MLEARPGSIERRQKLLDEVADHSYLLKSSRELGFVWAYGYWILFLLPSGLLTILLPLTDPTLRVICWLLGAAVPAILTGVFVNRKAAKESIRFDRFGFQVLKDGKEIVSEKWCDIESISFQSRKYWLRHFDGSMTGLSLPATSYSRERQLLAKIFRAYRLDKGPTSLSKKVIACTSLSLVIGLFCLFSVGRPAILSRNYDGPVGPSQYQQVALWCLGAILVVPGLTVPFFRLFSILISREQELASKHVSRFGPTLSEYLDENAFWPQPIELKTGKQYRYIDPDSIVKSMKDRLGAYWIFLVTALLFATMAGIGTFQSFQQGKPDVLALMIPFLGCLAGAIWCWFGLQYQRRKADVSEDIISITEVGLLVKREGRTLTYPKHPLKVMKDSMPKKETRVPFGKLEKHGTKPDIYEIDRRYLMEIPNQD